jgi:hypothetical protein
MAIFALILTRLMLLENLLADIEKNPMGAILQKLYEDLNTMRTDIAQAARQICNIHNASKNVSDCIENHIQKIPTYCCNWSLEYNTILAKNALTKTRADYADKLTPPRYTATPEDLAIAKGAYEKKIRFHIMQHKNDFRTIKFLRNNTMAHYKPYDCLVGLKRVDRALKRVNKSLHKRDSIKKAIKKAYLLPLVVVDEIKNDIAVSRADSVCKSARGNLFRALVDSGCNNPRKVFLEIIASHENTVAKMSDIRTLYKLQTDLFLKYRNDMIDAHIAKCIADKLESDLKKCIAIATCVVDCSKIANTGHVALEADATRCIDIASSMHRDTVGDDVLSVISSTCANFASNVLHNVIGRSPISLKVKN